MSIMRPPASPPCWGVKFQDGEKECEQCRYNDTCRLAVLARVAAPSAHPSTSLTVLRNYAPPSPPPAPVNYRMNPPAQTVAPLPANPYYVTQNAPLPRSPSAPVAPQVTQPQQPQYYQQSTGYSLPNPQAPNPMQAMHRPGAPSPAYYFTQYPGESVAQRVGKNLFLRAAEAVFGELMQFFRHWTWPPQR